MMFWSHSLHGSHLHVRSGTSAPRPSKPKPCPPPSAAETCWALPRQAAERQLRLCFPCWCVGLSLQVTHSSLCTNPSSRGGCTGCKMKAIAGPKLSVCLPPPGDSLSCAHCSPGFHALSCAHCSPGFHALSCAHCSPGFHSLSCAHCLPGFHALADTDLTLCGVVRRPVLSYLVVGAVELS